LHEEFLHGEHFDVVVGHAELLNRDQHEVEHLHALLGDYALLPEAEAHLRQVHVQQVALHDAQHPDQVRSGCVLLGEVDRLVQGREEQSLQVAFLEEQLPLIDQVGPLALLHAKFPRVVRFTELACVIQLLACVRTRLQVLVEHHLEKVAALVL